MLSQVRFGSRYWPLVGTLIVVLLLLGVYDEPVLAAFTRLWQGVLAAVGLGQQAQSVQAGINGGITKRFLPAVATYAALYLGICLLLLRLLLPSPAHWRLALQLYAGALVIYVALVLLGKLAGDAFWAYRLARHLLDFVVSPLPVAALYVLFQAGFGPQEERR
ncbi:XrtX-associated membrane protein [Hymenobacter sp.]|uniref:XrtX-associated membrane protein n=1 Tax=Hymenobacter sp. TaxID=1898978 RepID=UPI0039C888D0